MPVSFADNARDAIETRDLTAREKAVKEKLRADVRAERARLKDVKNLAQLFLGWVLVCVLAFYSRSANLLIGMSTTPLKGDAVQTFNSFGHSSTVAFPTYKPSAAPFSLVAAGMRRKFIIVPEYTTGLYLSQAKLDELVAEKNLRGLAVPAAMGSKSAANAPFLVLQLTFALDVDTTSLIKSMTDVLGGGNGKEPFRLGVADFRQALSEQVGEEGVQKGDSIEFLFSGMEQLGVAARGGQPSYVKSTDVRRRLLTVYAGSKSITPELPALLESAYIQ